MSFRRYERYRNSGVDWLGPVPESWQTTKIKRLIHSIDYGWSPQCEAFAAESETDWAVLKVGCVNGGNFDPSENKMLPQELEPIPALGVTRGDLLVSRANTRELVGSAAVADRDFPRRMLCDKLYRIRCDVDLCLPGFLARYLGSTAVREQIELAATGASDSMVNIDQSAIADLAIAVPPIKEQLSISRFLDRETKKIDGLIAQQERLIELVMEKRQAVISRAVTNGLSDGASFKETGIALLQRIPKHWGVIRLNWLTTKITNGYVGPTRDILRSEGVRYLQSVHIKANQIRFDEPYYVSEAWSNAHKKSILTKGDVLIVQTGDIGKVAVVPDEFVGCNCHALIIATPRQDIVSGEWLACVLSTNYGRHSLRALQTGALHPHLNCGDVKDIPIPVPSLTDQRAIVQACGERAAEFDALITEARRAVGLLQERRTALVSSAVTGKIDVRGLVDTAADREVAA